MPNAPWKVFERLVGSIIGGKRYWSNSGESVDCIGPVFLAQCKLVKRLSLSELSDLAEAAHRDGVTRGRVGIVAVKLRRGAGVKTPVLFIFTEEAFKEAHGSEANRHYVPTGL